MADEFPRLVYKKSDKGNAQQVWKLGKFETRRVADQSEADAALADGWTLSPSDEPAPAKKTAPTAKA